MARLELILQAVTQATHAQSIRALLNRIAARSVLISVGFVSEAGVEALEPALGRAAARSRFFIGIRNGITTVQGVKRLLRLRTRVYAVDTGSRDTIFHPKLYMAASDRDAGLVIGSANLTHQGLHNNIEASTLVTLDLADAHDRAFVDNTERSFDNVIRNFPQHVFQIDDEAHADALFEAGRLTDETIIPAPLVVDVVRRGNRDKLPRMALHRVARRLLRPVRRVPAARRAGAPARAAALPATPILDYYRVWESKALSKRDLNVPTGTTTNKTGSILLKKGAMEDIDQRHFFREEIFAGLVWTPDPKRTHLERARAKFELIVKGLNYGDFMLRLTHNTDVHSRTYEEKNGMTHLSWGDAKEIVGKNDLLGRTMTLYRKDTTPPEFLIAID
jgi:HKD family nuclease